MTQRKEGNPMKYNFDALRPTHTLNEVKTDKGYAADGFLPHEIPMIRRHDELHNRLFELNDEEIDEMLLIAEKLGL